MKLKKVLSILLAVIMVIGMLPVGSAAADDLTWSGGTITLASGTKIGTFALTTLSIYKQGATSTAPEIVGAEQYGTTINITLVIDEATGMDKFNTEPVPDGKPIPIEPENSVIGDKEFTCFLTVRCDTILNNIDLLDSEKIDLVPKDGIIFAEKAVTFYEGESVFNLLMREMKRNKIHMEFENTPIYNSAYIEGIANLYEFDCGELSGWMYRVNGWFPNYGCSRYQLKAGDRVEWVYTCDLGRDVGGYYSANNGN